MRFGRPALFAIIALGAIFAQGASADDATPPQQAETPGAQHVPHIPPSSPVVRLGDADSWFCSGVFIGKPNIVLSAGHCVDDEIARDGYSVGIDGYDLKAVLMLASVPETGFDDFAIFRIAGRTPANWTPAVLDCGPPLAVGAQIEAAGYPAVIGHLVRSWGRIAAMPARLPREAPWRQPVYTAQLPVGHGDSGGPVFNAATGRVVALMVGQIPDQPDWSVLQPVGVLCAILHLSGA